MYRSKYRSSFGADWEDELAGGIVEIAIVVLVILIYLAIRAINLIVRVLAKYPHVKTLWILLACALGLSVVAIALQGQGILQQGIATLAGLCWAALLCACKFVEVYYDTLFQQPRIGTVHQVLHQPWWQTP